MGKVMDNLMKIWEWVFFVVTCLAICYLTVEFILRLRGWIAKKGRTRRKLGRTITLARGSRSRVGFYQAIGDREYQQDHAAVDEDLPGQGCMAVLCDGMGGMENGGEASLLCVRSFARDCRVYMEDPVEFLRREAAKLNEQVQNLRDKNGEHLRSGTTLVAVLNVQGRIYWLNVGDSRIYLWRDGKLYPLTVDHNYSLQIKEEIERGEMTIEAANQESRQEALISYIGIHDLSRIDVGGNYPQQAGDIYMLCSDGVNKAITDEEIAAYFAERHDRHAGELARGLVQYVLEHKNAKQDNTTVAIMKC